MGLGLERGGAFWLEGIFETANLGDAILGDDAPGGMTFGRTNRGGGETASSDVVELEDDRRLVKSIARPLISSARVL